ncbi:unnamed protein product, partial [Symbiodinium necroappetens]
MRSDTGATVQSVAALQGTAEDGSVSAWGHPDFGGVTPRMYNTDAADPPFLNDVTSIQSNSSAFAALRRDGSVRPWGDADRVGGRAIDEDLTRVVKIQSNRWAFVAIKQNGSVEAWGHLDWGGLVITDDGRPLLGVANVQATVRAFAAILHDGSVQAWGDDEGGGDLPVVVSDCREIQVLSAARRSVVFEGGFSEAVRPDLWSFDWLDFAWTLECRESREDELLPGPAVALPGPAVGLVSFVLLLGPQSACCGCVGSSFACRVLAVAVLVARLLVGPLGAAAFASGQSRRDSGRGVRLDLWSFDWLDFAWTLECRESASCDLRTSARGSRVRSACRRVKLCLKNVVAVDGALSSRSQRHFGAAPASFPAMVNKRTKENAKRANLQWEVKHGMKRMSNRPLTEQEIEEKKQEIARIDRLETRTSTRINNHTTEVARLSGRFEETEARLSGRFEQLANLIAPPVKRQRLERERERAERREMERQEQEAERAAKQAEVQRLQEIAAEAQAKADLAKKQLKMAGNPKPKQKAKAAPKAKRAARGRDGPLPSGKPPVPEPAVEAKESVEPAPVPEKEAAVPEALPEAAAPPPEESKDVPLAVPEPPAEVQVVTPVKKTKDLGKTPSKPEKQKKEKKEKKQAKDPESDKVPAGISSEEFRVCLQNHHKVAVSKPSEDLQRFTVGGFGFRLLESYPGGRHLEMTPELGDMVSALKMVCEKPSEFEDISVHSRYGTFDAGIRVDFGIVMAGDRMLEGVTGFTVRTIDRIRSRKFDPPVFVCDIQAYEVKTDSLTQRKVCRIKDDPLELEKACKQIKEGALELVALKKSCPNDPRGIDLGDSFTLGFEGLELPGNKFVDFGSLNLLEGYLPARYCTGWEVKLPIAVSALHCTARGVSLDHLRQLNRSRIEFFALPSARCSSCLSRIEFFAPGSGFGEPWSSPWVNSECFREVFALHREFVEFPQPLRSQQLGRWHDATTYFLWGRFITRCLLSGIVPASQRTSVRLQLQRAGRLLVTFEFFVQVRDVMRLSVSLDRAIDVETFYLGPMRCFGETQSYMSFVYRLHALPQSEGQFAADCVEWHFFSDDE